MNVFGVENGALRWDERLIRRHYLSKVEGMNDAAKRHDSIYFAEKFARHRKWAGWISICIAVGMAGQVFDGNWRDANKSTPFLMALVYWWNISGDLRQMFLKTVAEIDRRVASDPAVRERFSEEQIQLNQQLEIRRRQQQIQDKKDEVVGLQKQLESLHRQLGLAVATGDPLLAGDIRARIARTESELRSRGH